MRVLLTSQPGEGHWRPLAGLALALTAAGHEIAFATTPACCATISRHGFPCFPVGVDDDGSVARSTTDASGGAVDPASGAVDPAADVWRFVFAGRRVERMLPGVLALVRDWRPALVVREISEFSGALAGEALGVPHAALQVSAWRPHLHDLIAAPLYAHRAKLDLSPVEPQAALYRYLLLSPVPPRYRDAASPYPLATYPIRIPGYDLQPDHRQPGWLVEPRERPRIYATLGTAYNHFPEIFEAIIAAVAGLDVELVVTTGSDPAALGLGAMPPKVRLLDYLPQSLAFPHCDLVISHGGFGTVQTALRHGLPQILLPIAADQPDNSALCEAHGVGLVVERGSVATLRGALETVLGDARYRQRAGAWRQAIEDLSGPHEAVRALESLAAAGGRHTSPR